MKDAFIERRYELRGGLEVLVRLEGPRPGERGDFRCDYEIVWPDRVRRFYAGGVDEVQALYLAMKSVHAELLFSPEGRRGEITWLGSSDLGLPVADSTA